MWIWVDLCGGHEYMYASVWGFMNASVAPKCQKGTLDLPNLESPVVVSWKTRMLRTKLDSLGKLVSAFNHGAISLKHATLFYMFRTHFSQYLELADLVRTIPFAISSFTTGNLQGSHSRQDLLHWPHQETHKHIVSQCLTSANFTQCYFHTLYSICKLSSDILGQPHFLPLINFRIKTPFNNMDWMSCYW